MSDSNKTTEGLQNRIREVLKHHGLTKHGDGVVEADLIAAMQTPTASNKELTFPKLFKAHVSFDTVVSADDLQEAMLAIKHSFPLDDVEPRITFSKLEDISDLPEGWTGGELAFYAPCFKHKEQSIKYWLGSKRPFKRMYAVAIKAEGRKDVFCTKLAFSREDAANKMATEAFKLVPADQKEVFVWVVEDNNERQLWTEYKIEKRETYIVTEL